MRDLIRPLFFYGLFATVLYMGGVLLAPFFGAILWAIAIGIVFFPFHRYVSRKVGLKSPLVVGLVSDLAVLLLFVVPIGLLIWAVVSEVDRVLPLLRQGAHSFSIWFKSNPLNSHTAQYLPQGVRHQLEIHSDSLQQHLRDAAQQIFTRGASLGTTLAGNTAEFLMAVIIFLFVLFFVFRDGPAFLDECLSLMPLDADSKRQLREKMHLTILGVMRGTFLTSLVQGMTAFVGFFIVQAQGAILLGTLTAVAALIPSIGTALIWMPVALVYFAMGHWLKGLIILGWGICVVGVVDNLVRPYLVGSKADMPFLWLFLGILGGIKVFGILGLLIGPLVIGLIPVLADIYKRHYMPTH